MKLKPIRVALVIFAIAVIITGCGNNNASVKVSAKVPAKPTTKATTAGVEMRPIMVDGRKVRKTTFEVHLDDHREVVATMKGIVAAVQYMNDSTYIQFVDGETAIINDQINIVPGRLIKISGGYDEHDHDFYSTANVTIWPR